MYWFCDIISSDLEVILYVKELMKKLNKQKLWYIKILMGEYYYLEVGVLFENRNGKII